jgi:hypothetical protein
MNTVLRMVAVGAIALPAALSLSHQANAQSANNVIFPMVVSAGAKTCLPLAVGRVTISPLGPVENMHVEISHLPANTDFDVFVIQVPDKPFGLSWYQGDINTDSRGNGVADFTGRFSKETFIVAPGVAPAPLVDGHDASTNPATPPVHTAHLGIWFNSPTDAGKAHCATTVTPFNGEHTAGIQVLNTSTFAPTKGPLLQLP